jgi:hypothetical protein
VTAQAEVRAVAATERKSRKRRRSRLSFILPRQPEWAMGGFALLSFLGGISIAYYGFSGDAPRGESASFEHRAIYEVRAVAAEEFARNGVATGTRIGENSRASARPGGLHGSDQSGARHFPTPRQSAEERHAISLADIPELRGSNGASAYGVAIAMSGSASAAALAPGGSAMAAMGVVPEPATWNFASVALAVLSVVVQRRRRQREL